MRDRNLERTCLVKRAMFVTYAAGLALLGLVAVASAGEPTSQPASADWPQFGGPNRDGHSAIKGIRRDWTGGLKKIWEVKDLSPDTCTWSPPSVQGNRLIVMGQRANPADNKGNTDTAYCFDADKGGEPLWKQDFPDEYGDYGWGTGPTAAPTIDGDKVFVAGRDGSLLCLNMADGKVLWKGRGAPACHGYSSSPLVCDDLLIVAGLSYKPGQYALLGAANKNTGQAVWNYGKAHGGDSPEYGHVSPARMKLNGKDQVVYSTGSLVCGMDIRTGQPLWEHAIEKGWGGNYTPAGPVLVWPFFYVTTSDARPPIGLQLDGTTAKEAWRGFTGNKGKYAPSLSQAIAVNGYLYSFTTLTDDRDNNWFFGGGPKGCLICVEPKTGLVKWEEKTGNGNVIAVDGCLLGLTHAGDLLLAEASPDGFKKITEWKGAIARHPWMYKGKEYKKDPAPCWAGPVVARGKLYLRYDDTLSCYELAAPRN